MSLRAPMGRKDTVFERYFFAIGSAALEDTVSQGIGQERHLLSVSKYHVYRICHIFKNQNEEGYSLQ